MADHPFLQIAGIHRPRVLGPALPEKGLTNLADQLGTLLFCTLDDELVPLLERIIRGMGLLPQRAETADGAAAIAATLLPRLILLDRPSGASGVCHRLKMNPQSYFIPLFLVREAGDDSLETSFLANESFTHPLDLRLLEERLHRYLFRQPAADRETGRTLSREVWIEQKVRDAYSFSYHGTLDPERLQALTVRIGELLVVGRRDFTLNLLEAEHLGNIPAAAFIELDRSIRVCGGHLKLIVPPTELGEELSRQGLDTDQYCREEEPHPPADRRNPPWKH
jgi:DNA-binding response OmpR family regulator